MKITILIGESGTLLNTCIMILGRDVLHDYEIYSHEFKKIK